MSQSTPLDKLEGSSGSDANLVSKILSDINGPSQPQHQQPLMMPTHGSPNFAMSQQGSPRLVLQEPPIQSTQEYTMDSAPATAHMIGNSMPSPQDFASMMNSYSSIPQNQPMEPMQMPAPQKQDMWSYLAERIRAPIVVTALFFLLNLPLFRTSIMQFAPWAFRAGAELSIVGLVMISLIAGLLFAGYQLLSDIIGL
jgi:hypothetical protein